MGTTKNGSVVYLSKRFPKIAAFIKSFLEYTNDYLGGQKWRVARDNQHNEQR